MKVLFYLFCALFLTAAGCTNSNETGKIFMEKNALLIDVRTPEEFQQGSLPRALNLPLDTVETQISSVAPDKKTPLYLYCRSGRRSGKYNDDGDQITAKIIWTQEGNEECEKVMNSKSFILNSNGSNIRIADLEAIQTLYVLTKNP